MSQYSFPPCDLPPGTPVVASVRVSPGPHQDLDAQRDYIIEFCKFYQLVLVKIFEDRAKSGGSVVGRDGLVAMVEFVLSQPIESVKAVIFYHTSRLARDMADAQQTSAMFRQSGREVLYLQNPIPSGSVGPLIESVFFYTDQQYRETLREQVVNGQMRIRGLKDVNGDYLGVYGGRTPFGFLQERIDIGITRNNGEKRILTVIKPDPALAPKILLAFALRAAGWIYRELPGKYLP
jgi:DNA invertase Pin-like site-specific DNA recombinase